MQDALKREFVQKYLDENGLGKLQDEAEENLANIRNDNGILFTAYGYMLLDKLNARDGADYLRFYHAVKTLTIEPGLYMRRPDTMHISEAHDNRAGIAVGSAIFDCTFARDLVEYGTRYGFQYANQDKSKYQVKQMAQGGDIALYKICAGYIPYPTEWIWLIGGMLTAVLRGWSSTWNLFYLRAHGVDVAMKRYAEGASDLWYPYLWSWALIKPVLLWIAKKRFGGLKESMRLYFGDKHILTRLSMLQSL